MTLPKCVVYNGYECWPISVGWHSEDHWLVEAYERMTDTSRMDREHRLWVDYEVILRMHEDVYQGFRNEGVSK